MDTKYSKVGVNTFCMDTLKCMNMEKGFDQNEFKCLTGKIKYPKK